MEMKFLLDEPLARRVEEFLAPRMTLDPHADPALGNAYRITSLYCDNPEFEVFHRVGVNRRRKYRIRRYGSDTVLFLERKVKRGEKVRKRRVTIDPRQIEQLSAQSPAAEWPGDWFHRQLQRRRLLPICSVEYLRTAYVAGNDDSPLRLTFDRRIRAACTLDWLPSLTNSATTVLGDSVVVEFKFRGELPPAFKTAIQEFQLVPTGVSKYRHSVQALGLVSNGSAPHA